MTKHWTDSFAAAVADIRHKLLEEGWFGKAVTPRSQTVTLTSAGEQSPAEKLGWFRRDEGAPGSPTPEHDRDAMAKEAKAPDRGIDL